MESPTPFIMATSPLEVDIVRIRKQYFLNVNIVLLLFLILFQSYPFRFWTIFSNTCPAASLPMCEECAENGGI